MPGITSIIFFAASASFWTTIFPKLSILERLLPLWCMKFTKRKTVSCLKNILLTLFMFTSDQTFTTTLSLYKALLQWAFVEIWTQFRIVPETGEKKQKTATTLSRSCSQRCVRVAFADAGMKHCFSHACTGINKKAYLFIYFLFF